MKSDYLTDKDAWELKPTYPEPIIYVGGKYETAKWLKKHYPKLFKRYAWLVYRTKSPLKWCVGWKSWRGVFGTVSRSIA